MEARFGEDFSRVRIHRDQLAAEAARKVDARAYTVGQNIVFGAGQYAPQTRAGQQVLAHELTHTLQQRLAGPLGQAEPLSVSRPDDPLEREAEFIANQTLVDAVESRPSGANRYQRSEQRIQRLPPPPDAAVPTPATKPAAASSPTTKPGVCGPDVTAQVTAALSGVRSTFGSWSANEKNAACEAADNASAGAVTSWDILPLFHGSNGWILRFRPACATAGAQPLCGSSVQVGGDCYFSGTANYVLFGVMCSLCFDHFTATAPKEAARFTEPNMLALITKYKGPGSILGQGANWAMCEEWSKAGYHGWPSGGKGPSPGDKANCSTTCPTPFSPPPDFKARWCPNLDPAKTCGRR